MYAYLVRSFAHIRKSLRIFAYWPYAIRSGGLYNGTLRTSNFLLSSFPKNVNATISARSCLLSYDNFHDLQMTCPLKDLNILWWERARSRTYLQSFSPVGWWGVSAHWPFSAEQIVRGLFKKVKMISLNKTLFSCLSRLKTVRKILTRICPNKINLYINHMYMFMRYTVASY